MTFHRVIVALITCLANVAIDTAFIQSELDRWAKVVKTANIRAE